MTLLCASRGIESGWPRRTFVLSPRTGSSERFTGKPALVERSGPGSRHANLRGSERQRLNEAPRRHPTVARSRSLLNSVIVRTNPSSAFEYRTRPSIHGFRRANIPHELMPGRAQRTLVPVLVSLVLAVRRPSWATGATYGWADAGGRGGKPDRTALRPTKRHCGRTSPSQVVAGDRSDSP
jgi:hypothetical protein